MKPSVKHETGENHVSDINSMDSNHSNIVRFHAVTDIGGNGLSTYHSF